MSSSNVKFVSSLTFLIALLALIAYYANEGLKRNHELDMARLQKGGSDFNVEPMALNSEPIAERTLIGFKKDPIE